MKYKKRIGILMSFTLTCCAIQSARLSFPMVPAADAQQSDSAGISENPFNKQDDMEVVYDRTRWVQPKEWNCPTINPRDYQGGIMLFFDKIALEPDDSRGKVQRVYCSITGATEPVSQMKFHIFYDTRLKVKPNENGKPATPGKALTDFTTGSAMIEEGQLAFYAVSDEDIMLTQGCLFTMDFIVPENAGPGEFYPIGMAYVDDGIAYDSFINSARDDAGKLQMTYLFTRGIHNGYIKMLGEKITTAPAKEETVRGDVNGDGGITVADAVLLCRMTAEDSCDDITLTQQSFIAADYNLDGLITIQDAAELLAKLQE